MNDEGREILAALGPGVPQVQAPDRVAAGQALLRAHPDVQVLLLDDGFQHRRLARDLDIVLLDGRRPLAHEALLPRGRLREPLHALARAGLVVVTRAEHLPPAARLTWSLDVAQHTAAPVLFASTRVVRLDGLADPQPAALQGLPVALLSGIGSPAAFRATVERLGATVVWHVARGDHRATTPTQLDALRRRAAAAGARALLMTRKDAMKASAGLAAPGAVPVGVVVVATDIVEGDDLLLGAVERALDGGPAAA